MREDKNYSLLRPVVISVMMIAGAFGSQSVQAAATDILDFLENDIGIDVDNAFFMGWQPVVPPTSTTELAEIAELNFGLAVHDDAGKLRFTIVNGMTENSVASTISDIYFDDGSPTENGVFFTVDGTGFVDSLSSPGTDFEFGNTGAPNWIFAEGENLDPDFETTDSISAGRERARANGIDALPEYLTLGYTYLGSNDFSSVVTALTNGSIRIGMHVIGIGQSGFSESIIWSPLPPDVPPTPGPNAPVVPIPAAAVLGMVGMGMVALTRRNKSTTPSK